MDSIVLPGGVGGAIPPEFSTGNLQAVPVIPQAIKDAQKAYIEEGNNIVMALDDAIANEDNDSIAVIMRSLRWLMKGQLPIEM